ncbi:uncharacterized protein G2W53_020215 [Senna tora]|uniref:Uncharacterized protein n=1 Tax=Senna tora TaxID=362788 RepID=A0A834TYL9_9FABA|nr:uncharacterized protein G2W53_020215 [Senna tora]
MVCECELRQLRLWWRDGVGSRADGSYGDGVGVTWRWKLRQRRCSHVAMEATASESRGDGSYGDGVGIMWRWKLRHRSHVSIEAAATAKAKATEARSDGG